MRKLFVAVIATAVALAGFAVYATADDGPQGTSWTHSLSNKKKAKPTGSNNIVQPAKVDDKGTEDTSDDRYVPPAVTVVKYAKGATIDPGAKAKCKRSASQVQSGAAKCPAKTRIGDGQANSVLGQSDDDAGTEIVAPIEAYNAPKKSIMFVVDPCAPGTGPTTGNACNPIPGARVVLLGKWSGINKRPTLRVDTPAQLLRGGVIITRFQLATDKITRKQRVRVGGKRRTIVRSYVTTPGACKGKWKSSVTMTYEDGSKLTVPDSMTCRRG